MTNCVEPDIANRTRRALLSKDARDVLIFRNPRSGSGKNALLVEELAVGLQARGFMPRVLDRFDALDQSVERELADGTLRAVVAAGGDGTLNALVNRLPASTPFLMLPLGTENLVAKYLGWRAVPAELIDMIQEGQVLELDAATADDKLFLLMFSCGLDAEVVHRLHAERSEHITHWSYAKPLWNALRRYKFSPFAMSIDGQSAAGETTARWAFVSNLPCYAGQLGITPDAVADDGRLDLCAFRAGSFWSSLRYLTLIVLRVHRLMPDCYTRRLETIRFESATPDVPYQIDGDPGGTLPVTVRVLPRRFRAVVSEKWLGRISPSLEKT